MYSIFNRGILSFHIYDNDRFRIMYNSYLELLKLRFPMLIKNNNNIDSLYYTYKYFNFPFNASCMELASLITF